ncbi:MAG: NADH:ubiquinone oxidoreductase subunit NDUFA12 [Alphaproteobacteria bacterium]|nr:NADH:ubiquinone oxidoreductase subunit NDUFA12 [Alphaproteobacteria bacterium]
MKNLKQFFTWWNGATWNTRFYTWRKGERVGQDALGNTYYRAKSAVPDSIPERRWVIYSNYSEASQIPAGWHGWMHHRVDTPPTQENYVGHEWQLPHQENMTGTAEAYHPPGSIVLGGKAQVSAPDYQAWKPE